VRLDRRALARVEIVTDTREAAAHEVTDDRHAMRPAPITPTRVVIVRSFVKPSALSSLLRVVSRSAAGPT